MKKYDNELEILKDFYTVRIDIYKKRKEYLQDQLTAESLKLDNQARFILEKIDGKIILGLLKYKNVRVEIFMWLLFRERRPSYHQENVCKLKLRASSTCQK